MLHVAVKRHVRRMSVFRQYKPSRLSNVENLELYRPGGYHPVHIGDQLEKRYYVIHKLGFGGT